MRPLLGQGQLKEWTCLNEEPALLARRLSTPGVSTLIGIRFDGFCQEAGQAARTATRLFAVDLVVHHSLVVVARQRSSHSLSRSKAAVSQLTLDISDLFSQLPQTAQQC
jgi:hypothetical protein